MSGSSSRNNSTMGSGLPAVLLLFLAASLHNASARGPPSEVSNSVIQVGFRDLEADNGGGRTLCETVVANSRKYAAVKLNFVLTINAEGTDKAFTRYYYNDGYGGKVYADAGSISRYQAGLTRCFKAAVAAGFTTLHLTPHVDPHDQNGRGVWRNLIRFDPTAKMGGFSYAEVLLVPAARALNAAVKADTTVEFALSAEQGLAVFSYPRQWLGLADSVKAISAKGKDPSKHFAGISFNFDKVCGCVEVEESDPIKYNLTYPARFQRFKAAGGLKTVDVEGVKALFAGIDFLGCSAYGSLPTSLQLADMEVSIQTVAFELAAFGIDLKNYLNKPFVYSEQGLGGYNQEGNAIAPDLATLSKFPMRGKWLSSYIADKDPWQRAQYRQYRRQLYKLLSDWAAQGGGPTYRIDGIYIWSVGTWDVQGVHPSSNSWAGSFADDVICNDLRANNAAANGRPANAALHSNVASPNVALQQQQPRGAPVPAPAAAVEEAGPVSNPASEPAYYPGQGLWGLFGRKL